MITEIHDIRPPVMVGMDPAVIRLGVWIGAGLLVLALVIWLVRYLLKSRKKATQVQAIPHIPPFDAAIRSLDRLSTTPIQDAKVFYFDLSHIVKSYIGGRVGINCLEMTTQELTRTMQGVSQIPPSLKKEIFLFQDLCDPFRYGPIHPDPSRVETDLARARDLITAMEEAVEEEIT
jgi:hypothetical protein